ncbi:MAG: hypothetical protein KDA68_24545, partial [Planctomycetaceae bacterium]|nr:hypothetical protein [Planctomycetaceae bacterium]
KNRSEKKGRTDSLPFHTPERPKTLETTGVPNLQQENGGENHERSPFEDSNGLLKLQCINA